jgi:hypothetical protein
MDAMSLDHDHHHHHDQENQEVAFTQTNLVADRTQTPGVTATTTIDPNLINPWGVYYGPSGPFWVSDNGAGVTTIAPREMLIRSPLARWQSGSLP